ncbi:hypothetical protein AvCA_23610 [Azotobacter vinelandii CA]|uniref:Uncharacterized protein n=2 Tax=Azotobacter vinelandii TaxID=354 RepID=C1DHF4_AZOVD|nr:hypothetical protein Avin_23610 [Azotobacter vinelandii DJ]AGK14976.1 hypothetical protein AvCA_23610 [Azotobacter vinelandii CA]AGK20580.1 hypothetical protein AvCA6_23610 [Azotobacter vinelandii CA6]
MGSEFALSTSYEEAHPKRCAFFIFRLYQC